ncbi:hypothetical protein F3K50_03405 [Pseudomonas marginalis]|nr:hypothetical protein F3K50_03405 [Pseudomonas marginalis]
MNLAELIAAIQQKEKMNPGKHVARIHFNEESFKTLIGQRNNDQHVTIAAISDHETQEYFLGIPYELNSFAPDYTLELSE